MKNKISTEDKLLWPNPLGNKIYIGFLDKELEAICNKTFLENYENRLPYKSGYKMYWPVENYSLGRCYREWLNLPSWFPLPFNGDHGINESTELTKSEIATKTNVYVTWSRDRFNSLKNKYKKKILHVPHPWVMFRRSYGLKKKENSKGTVIFLKHGTFGLETLKYNYKKYFSELRMLPKEYHPLVLCLHCHDVKTNVHTYIREHGLPMISVGDWNSPYFVERFYSIISRFNFATSNYGGSELFFCEEFGLNYFIKGDSTNFFNTQNEGLPYGLIKGNNLNSDLEKKKFLLFKEFPPKKNGEKKIFVDITLGLDLNENKSHKKLLKYLFIELIFHVFDYLIIIKFFKKICKKNIY